MKKASDGWNKHVEYFQINVNVSRAACTGTFIVSLKQHYAFVFWYSKSYLLHGFESWMFKINKAQKRCTLISSGVMGNIWFDKYILGVDGGCSLWKYTKLILCQSVILMKLKFLSATDWSKAPLRWITTFLRISAGVLSESIHLHTNRRVCILHSREQNSFLQLLEDKLFHITCEPEACQLQLLYYDQLLKFITLYVSKCFYLVTLCAGVPYQAI